MRGRKVDSFADLIKFINFARTLTQKKTGQAIATAYAHYCDPLFLEKYRYIEKINCYATLKLVNFLYCNP